MRHRFWFSFLVALAGLLLIPAIALAATNGTSGNGTVIVHVNTPVTLAADNTIDVLVEVNDNATVAGTVNQTLVIVNGDATVSGVVSHEVVVVNGTLNLDPSARVDNVTLVNSTVNQAAGSQVSGTIRQQSQLISSSALAFLSIVWWIGVTSLVLLLGLLVVAVARRTTRDSAALISRSPAESILAGILVAIGLPILMVLLMITVVGIPIGLALILVAFVLAFLGYAVSGFWLGELIINAVSSHRPVEHPYLAVLLGLLLLQVIELVPVLGGLIVLIATIIGTGALALLAWRAWRGPGRPVAAPVRPVEGPGDRIPA